MKSLDLTCHKERILGTLEEKEGKSEKGWRVSLQQLLVNLENCLQDYKNGKAAFRHKAASSLSTFQLYLKFSKQYFGALKHLQ